MKIEIRSGGEVHISGYVNAVERDSRVLPPQMAEGATSPFVEKVAAGAFGRAIARNPKVRMMFNHQRDLEGTLKLTEDNIGLRAEAVTSDPEAAAAAAKGELRGWSFGFEKASADWEPYREGIQRRTLKDFTLNEVSILTRTPAYFGTSVEIRSFEGEGGGHIRELRAFDDEIMELTAPADEAPAENGTEHRNHAAHIRRRLEITKLKGGI